MRCLGTKARYALRCKNTTSHPTQLCGIHRGQEVPLGLHDDDVRPGADYERARHLEMLQDLASAPKSGQNMNNRDGWVAVDCLASDPIRYSMTNVSSSLTDPEGTYGDPVVYTEWADDNGPILRDYRWMTSPGSCEHLVPTTKAKES